MYKKFFYTIIFSFFLTFIYNSNAQSDLRLFGYFQGVAYNQTNDITTDVYAGGNLLQSREVNEEYSSFDLQQANIMLQKDFGKGWGMFMNLEWTNNYSSSKQWGAFNFQEAFITYRGNDYFNLKAGMFLQTFNNLNEIINRTPLLPYLIRPFAYESAYDDLRATEDFLPQKALIQINGFIPVGPAKIDYAFNFGNAEDSYFTNPETAGNNQIVGISETSLKSVGGRVGLRVSDLKVGGSFTFDSDKQEFGNIPRTRIGADLSYYIAGFTLAGEVIMITEDLTDEQTALVESFGFENLDKMFYYALLQYDITDNLYAYGLYNYIEDNFAPFIAEGATGISGGLGYRITDEILCKAQYQQISIDAAFTQEGTDVEVNYLVNQILLGMSVMF